MMIRPNKYTDVKLSILGVSAEILHALKEEQSQKYTHLLVNVSNRIGDGAKTNFLLALVFLFSLGKIKYHQEVDVIELLANQG